MCKSRASTLAVLGVGLAALSMTANAEAGGRCRDYGSRSYGGGFYSSGFGGGFYSSGFGGGFYISGGRYDDCDYPRYRRGGYGYRSRGYSDRDRGSYGRGYGRSYGRSGFFVDTPRFRAGGFRGRHFSAGGFRGRHFGGGGFRIGRHRAGGFRRR